jgi:uncharacterized MAPEG superfamily protein
MDSFIAELPIFEDYKPALIGLALLCMIPLIQSFLSAPFAFVKQQQVPGMPLNGDHSLLSFRVLRAYANSVESLPAFGIVLLLAVISGVSPSIVNWLVAIHLVARLAFWVVYYLGIGKIAGGPRTMCYVVGLLSNMVLVCVTVYQLM